MELLSTFGNTTTIILKRRSVSTLKTVTSYIPKQMATPTTTKPPAAVSIDAPLGWAGLVGSVPVGSDPGTGKVTVGESVLVTALDSSSAGVVEGAITNVKYL